MMGEELAQRPFRKKSIGSGTMSKISRNAPCPCGSGKKYKKCCMGKEARPKPELFAEQLRKTEGELLKVLFNQSQQRYGTDAAAQAWKTYCMQPDIPFNPQTELEINTSFPAWLLFHWAPTGASQPIALEYLQRMDYRLPPLQRRFIKEACRQPFSFFIVTDVEPGRALMLHDLFWQRDITVYEQRASTMLSRGSILFGQVVALDEVAILFGTAPLAIPDAYQVRLAEARDAIQQNLGPIDATILMDLAPKLRSFYFEIRQEMRQMEEEQQQEQAGEAAKSADGPEQARQVTASDEIAARLTYELEDCSVREAFEALRTLSWKLDEGELPPDTLLDDGGEPRRIVFPWLEKGNRKPSKAPNPQLGRIVIDGGRLSIDVTDAEQMEPAQRKIRRRLGKQAMAQAPTD
jgi:Sec-independent protein translocase protein TatA